MHDWLLNNETLLWWLAVASVITFIVSVIIVPVILIRLPADYFSHKKKNIRKSSILDYPLIKFPLLIIKNSFAVILIIAGIVMLALPGQGLLTIVVGIVLLDFPGKYRAERWIIERKYILHAINWVRTKSGKPELLM